MSSLDHLIKKLAGASPSVTDESENTPIHNGVEKTDPVYVEKLASAVDFIVDSIGNETTAPTKEAETEALVETEVTKVADISAKLRGSLQEKLKSKTAAKTSNEDSELIQSVLSRLKGMRAAEEVQSKTDSVEEEVNQIYGIEEDSDSNELDGEAAVKAASADLSLADVLNAALDTDGQVTDSDPVVDDEVAKTASVQGSNGLTARKEATSLLKEKLLAKIGSEEAQS